MFKLDNRVREGRGTCAGRYGLQGPGGFVRNQGNCVDGAVDQRKIVLNHRGGGISSFI